eukprot:2014833-Heterocapsa_arctica.AAC.1
MEEEYILPAPASISLALFDKHDGGNKLFTLLMLFRMLIRARRSHITNWDDWVWTRSGAGFSNLCTVPRLKLTAGLLPLQGPRDPSACIDHGPSSFGSQ